MTDNIKLAVLNIINTISWMDDETKNVTIRKLEYMKTYLGYPDNYTNIINSLFLDVRSYEIIKLHSRY